ncbi:hypothetical protein HPB51_018394 [Rhipicephalus microplus]|uniref:Transposable element P transposase-like RNase H domain-containing protein n=1 Tax=Rhipicephalus microplus TaxID=6941 RepID=A0A9J6EUD1_RHIMP|nr:hypothetical protein HPB51_018394 [Rhipicephalus microplus]
MARSDSASGNVASAVVDMSDCCAMDTSSEPNLRGQGVQVDNRSTSSVLVVEKAKWRRKEKKLRSQLLRLQQTIDKYKMELKKLLEDALVAVVSYIKERANEKELAALFLIDQIENFKKKGPSWSEETTRRCVVLRHLSTRAYEHIRGEMLLKLPCRKTLSNYLGTTSGETGFSKLAEARLRVEAESLTVPQSRVCSLIVDETKIREKLQYNKQQDCFVGHADVSLERHGEDLTLANSLLCFLITGLPTSSQWPTILPRTLEHLRDQAGHTSSVSFTAAGQTIIFMQNIYRWFVLHDTSNTTQHIHKKWPDTRQFDDAEDARLEWLEVTLPMYLDELEKGCRSQKEFLTKETYEAFLLTTYSTVVCIKYLLTEEKFLFVLTRKFNSDPIESLFGTLRMSSGCNDMLNFTRSQDRGGLLYPSDQWLFAVDVLRAFADRALKDNPTLKNPLSTLVKYAVPALCASNLLKCKEMDDTHRAKRMGLISVRFLRPLLVNYAFTVSDKHDAFKYFAKKPLSRKYAKL